MCNRMNTNAIQSLLCCIFFSQSKVCNTQTAVNPVSCMTVLAETEIFEQQNVS